eukprot:158041_1
MVEIGTMQRLWIASRVNNDEKQNEAYNIYTNKGGDAKLQSLKQLLKKLQIGITFDNQMSELIQTALVSFKKIIHGINSDGDEKIDVDISCSHYELLTKRIIHLSITKQLIKHWDIESKNRGKNNVYTMSNDLTNLILGEETLYDGCHEAVYPFEVLVGSDACEPGVEHGFFMLVLMVMGRHRIDVMNWFNERLLVTECKDEFSQKTQRILNKSAVDWRKNHSSPIVKQSKYKISPSVDKVLGLIKKYLHISLSIPFSLLLPFKTAFLSKSEISRLSSGDIFEHKMDDGLFSACMVLDWEGLFCLKLKYVKDDELSICAFSENICDEILLENKFAYKNSISKRKNNRFKGLKIGAVLGVRYNGLWQQGTLVRKDKKGSGQYLFDINGNEYWYHMDDEYNVKRLVL